MMYKAWLRETLSQALIKIGLKTDHLYFPARMYTVEPTNHGDREN